MSATSLLQHCRAMTKGDSVRWLGMRSAVRWWEWPKSADCETTVRLKWHANCTIR